MEILIDSHLSGNGTEYRPIDYLTGTPHHESCLTDRRIAIRDNIHSQSQELEQYLTKHGTCSDLNKARFKILADRAAQTLEARENAVVRMSDSSAQEAIRHFPLDISPVVLHRNRPHPLSCLQAFSQNPKGQTSVSEVYDEVIAYAMNPEPLNIFIAPLRIDSGFRHRDTLFQQMWKNVCTQTESLFNICYSRNSASPVSLYSKAWNEEMATGAHASETLYYFLKDMPSIVIEPRVDGQRFFLMISAWRLGLESSDLIRTEIDFGLNFDFLLAKAAYTRSKKMLQLLTNFNPSTVDNLLGDKVARLRQNIILFESITDHNGDIYPEADAMDISEIFQIEPEQDLEEITPHITRHLNTVLASLTDMHHLLSACAEIRFPKILKDRLPELYDNPSFRKQVFEWYGSIFTLLVDNSRNLLTENEQREITAATGRQIADLASILDIDDN